MKIMSIENERPYWNSENPWGHELVANCLADENVEVIFTVTGGNIAPILKSISDKGIKVLSTRTEEAAVLAAAGYSLSSNKTGVAVLTAGMTTHAAAGIVNASFGQVPVVVIAGASETYADGRWLLQEIAQAPFAQASFAKAAFHVTKWARIPEMISWAFREAITGVPGCAFVDIPVDLMASRDSMSKTTRYATGRTNARPAGDLEPIKKAIKALSNAKQPLISIGRLAVASNAEDEVKEFVEMTGIPVDSCFGTLGASAYNIGLPICHDADVVLMLGKQSVGLEGAVNSMQYTGRLISVYPDAGDIGRCYPVDIGIVGDVKLVLQQMIEEAKGVGLPDFSPWLESLKARKKEFKAHFQDVAKKFHVNRPIHPARLTAETVDWMVHNNLQKEALIAVDGADIMAWWSIFGGMNDIMWQFPGQVAGLLGLQHSLGSMGCGLAMAIGAVCAQPDRFLVMPSQGDGALGYHIAELETLARLGVPGVIIVSNNSCWGMVYADQRRIWGKDNAPGAFLAKDLHYEKAAEALGCAEGEFVDDPGEIRPALDRAYERAKTESKPVVVNVITDPNVYNFPWPWWVLPETPEGDPYVEGE